jgi:methionine-rich copper-binding protein CopC
MSIRVFAVAFAAALMLSHAHAFAHAELVSANPPANGTVQAAPEEISITFSEAVEAKFSAIEVLDDKNQRLEVGKPQRAPNDPKTLRVTVKPLRAGTYKVIWHAVSSDDSHKTKGTYEFTVKP